MSTDAPDNLTPKQEEAIVALLNHPTVKQAAEAIGINERTLHRWLDEEAFARAYRRARRLAFSHAISTTQKFTPVAVQVLVKVATDKAAPHAARVSASTALLKFSRESIELDDVVERVERLERSEDERKSRDGAR